MDEIQKVNEKYTLEQFTIAVKGSHGIKATIMRRLGCSRQTVENYLDRYKTLRRAYDEETEVPLDVAESLIVNDMVVNRSVDTAKWYLKAKGRERGYVERQEVEHSGEIAVKGYATVTPDDWTDSKD